MKKLIPLLLSLSLLFQSCFTTQYVSNTDRLRNEFRGATVDDIEFEFCDPDEYEELRSGYAYTYYYGYLNRNQRDEMYTRFAFDNNDYVRNIQSTRRVPQKKFSGGGTAAAIIFIPIGIITLFVIIVAGASE